MFIMKLTPCVISALALMLPIAAFAASTYSTLDYVQDGLVVFYDGIANGGMNGETEIHDPDAETWVDLTGHGHDLVQPSAEEYARATYTGPWPWTESALICTNVANSLPTLYPYAPSVTMNWNKMTIEVVHTEIYNPSGNMHPFWSQINAKAYASIFVNGQKCLFCNVPQSDTASNQLRKDMSTVSRDGTHSLRYDPANNVYALWFKGEKLTSANSSSYKQFGEQTTNFEVGNHRGDNAYCGVIHAVRVYDRCLSEDEMKWNNFLDRVRFYGEDPLQSTTVKIAGEPANYGTSVPAYGSYAAVGETTFDISGSLVTSVDDDARITTQSLGDGVRAVYLGYEYAFGPATAPHAVVAGEGTEESVELTPCNFVANFTWRFDKQFRAQASAATGGKVRLGARDAAAADFVWVSDGGTVMLKAVPDENWSFSGWTGTTAGIDPASAEVTLPMTLARTLVANFVYFDPQHEARQADWTGAAGTWNDPALWGGETPGEGDTVTMAPASAATVTLTTLTAHLRKLEVGNKATLVIQGWSSCVEADEIVVRNGGTIKIADAFDDTSSQNRVWLKGTTLTVEEGGSIRADGAGYAKNCGPCWSYAKSLGNIHSQAVAGHGGEGANWPGSTNAKSVTYGDPVEPTTPGSGGCSHAGGGAIRLDFSGAVTIDGTVSAKAGGVSGAGGSVWISCASIGGAGTVRATADGVQATSNTKVGGGGRIAVHYEAEAQTARGDVCTIRFRTRGGRATDPTDVPRTTFERDVSYNGTLTHLSRPGTLYFTDNRFLLSSAAYRAAGWPFSGVWMSGAALPDAVVVDGDLTMDRTWLIFPKSGLSLSVSGDLTMTGTGWYAGLENGLELTNGTVTVGGDLTLNGSRLGLYAGGAVSVGGNLVMAAPVDKEHAGGQIEIVAAVTNGTEECGASVSVGKTWTIAKNCRVYPVASTNGAIVKLTARKMTVAEGGMINASLRGYPEGKGPGAPLHSYAGASYGGLGGAYPGYENKLAATYGDEKRPLAPGSAGLRQNNSYPCYAGGGAVWLEVAKALTLDGLVQADGNWKFCTYASGCSGGAVYIRALHLYGSGSVVARGGDCRDALVTPGGGGRVAIWCCENQSSIFDNVSVDAGCFDGKRYTEPTTSAEDGSVFWGDLPLPGTLLLVR